MRLVQFFKLVGYTGFFWGQEFLKFPNPDIAKLNWVAMKLNFKGQFISMRKAASRELLPMLAGRHTTDNRCFGNWSGSVPARVPRWFAYPPHAPPPAPGRRVKLRGDEIEQAADAGPGVAAAQASVLRAEGAVAGEEFRPGGRGQYLRSQSSSERSAERVPYSGSSKLRAA